MTDCISIYPNLPSNLPKADGNWVGGPGEGGWQTDRQTDSTVWNLRRRLLHIIHNSRVISILSLHLVFLLVLRRQLKTGLRF